MNIIQAGRQAGKTTYLIEQMKKDPEHSVMICVSQRRAEDLRRAHAQPWEQDSPLTSGNFLAPRSAEFRTNPGVKVFIDDLDVLLQQMFGDVSLVTTSRPVRVEHLPPVGEWDVQRDQLPRRSD